MSKGAAKPDAARAPSAPRVLSLAQRPVDVLLSLWFVLFAFTTTFTDIHNFTASYYGVDVEKLETMDLVYPPKVLTQLYFRWARTVDPLLYQNPVWWQCIEWVNMLCLTPFALVAAVAFLRGSGWIRVPAIVVSSFTTYSLILCIGTTLYGPVRSADPSTFTGIYVLYLLQPMLVVWRLSEDRPFEQRMGDMKDALLNLLTIANLTVFFAYVAKWIALYEPGFIPEAALPAALQLAHALP